jgi:hypothetical protein
MDGQPMSDADMHDPNKVGPSAAPPVEKAEGGPLDPATEAALDPDKQTPLDGGSEPLEPQE